MHVRRFTINLSIAMLSVILTLGVGSQLICAPFDYQCKFTKGGWTDKDWKQVKGPSWDYFGTWVQDTDHIRNYTKPGLTPKEAEGTNSYSSMILTHKVGGAVEISSTMSFDYQMAPLIVLADDLGESKDGKPEYRKHTEIVLYNQGLNVWQHFYKDGKQSYIKLVWATLKFKPKHKYDLKVTVKDKVITIKVDGNELGCTDVDLSDDFYVGITGCEGINRFYNFKVHAER